jgi:hypothetical protein
LFSDVRELRNVTTAITLHHARMVEKEPKSASALSVTTPPPKVVADLSKPEHKPMGSRVAHTKRALPVREYAESLGEATVYTPGLKAAHEKDIGYRAALEFVSDLQLPHGQRPRPRMFGHIGERTREPKSARWYIVSKRDMLELNWRCGACGGRHVAEDCTKRPVMGNGRHYADINKLPRMILHNRRTAKTAAAKAPTCPPPSARARAMAATALAGHGEPGIAEADVHLESWLQEGPAALFAPTA